MNKKNLIDLTIDFLTGGALTPALKSVYHPEIVKYQLEVAFDTLLGQGDSDSVLNEMGIPNWRYDSMTKAYLLSVEYDTLRDKYYSNLPVGVMSLNNNSGIRMIYPTKSEESAFIPRSQTDNFLMGTLDVNKFTDIVRFTYESNNTVYYTASESNQLLCRLHKENKSVYAKLAVKFGALEDTDEITVPDGKLGTIFQFVAEALSRKKPEDLTDDNVPNQP